MRRVTFYHRETGIFHPSTFTTSDDSVVAANIPPGHIAIDHPDNGVFDRLSQRVDIATGQVIDYRPPTPGPDHEWNSETKRWQMSVAAMAREGALRAARRRIAELEACQHAVVRELLLGDAAAKLKLQAIHEEISRLSAL